MAIQHGMNQQTPAVQNTLRGISRQVNRALGKVRKRRKKVKATARKVKRAASRVKRGVQRLKKGSAAAKAYMAKIRKLRKK